jgi:uncharacterized protein YcaQ
VRITLDHLRRYAVARSLFKPTQLGRAVRKLGFLQADPIRAPARAQDLTLRHRVVDYHVGDLERRYPRLHLEEDFFVNYGFLPRATHALMHPRIPRTRWSAARARKAQAILEFVHKHGAVHPRLVDSHFAHGKITNWFGGTSNVTTFLLDQMHYRGLVRVARREGGTRIYAPRREIPRPPEIATASARFDRLVDIVMAKYGPLPAASLGQLLSLLCGGVPQLRKQRASALTRAKERFPQVRLDGVHWYWPAGESPTSRRWQPDDRVRLLAPFDPVVWDRRRFGMLWGWQYRFEAYTPAPKRQFGYYALPLLWRDQVIGWGNLAVVEGKLQSSFGFARGGAPKEPAFREELELELVRFRSFLRLAP